MVQILLIFWVLKKKKSKVHFDALPIVGENFGHNQLLIPEENSI